jgi:glycosyltransferase involved in cell wall biosynthesis
MTFFSVVIPNFNSGKYLSRALQSVVNQTTTNWEIIVVDNNSTDESRHAVSGFNDSRIRQVQINNDGIIAKSRNFGVEMARGDYIAFLDADDFWSDTKLSTTDEIIQETKSTLIYHRLRRVPGKKWLRPNVGNHYPKGMPNLLIQGNRIPNSSVVAKKTLITLVGGIDESRSLIASEDFDLWIRLVNAGAKLHFEPKVLGSYEESPTSANNDERRVQSAVALLAKHDVSVFPGWLRIAIEMGGVKLTGESKKTLGALEPNSFTRKGDYFLYIALVLRRVVFRVGKSV